MIEIRLVNSNTIEVIVDLNVYNNETLYKCFYWYSGDFAIDLKNVETKFCCITLTSTNNTPIDIQPLSKKIKTDLIDFKLRDIVAKETINIRELLIAQAFSNYELEEEVTGKISDPVGFDPRNIK